MIVYPAIDLKAGQCVRLRHGRMDQATVFNPDPVAQAQSFEAAGAQWLHLVDLDGAFAGHTANGAAIEAICQAVQIPIQLGGGVRTLEIARHWLERGIERVILGTLAVREPAQAQTIVQTWPGRVVIGLDAHDGMLAVAGWDERTHVAVDSFARTIESWNPAALIHTDIGRDGVLTGVNVEASGQLAQLTATPVIASGGVAGLDDVRALVQSTAVAGVIVGRALYEQRFTLAQAIAAATP